MRIAIVNDVQLVMEGLVRIINSSEHELAWCAWNGLEAVKLSKIDPPDLILMDLIMPEMDGVQATRAIMQTQPCPILIVTASIAHQCDIVFEAMGAGALDAVTTPVLNERDKEHRIHSLLRKIAMIESLTAQNQKLTKKQLATDEADGSDRHIVVVGSSSGGPEALSRLLADLPEDFHSPIVIVQHVDAQFAPALAKWLNGKTALDVDVANEGNIPAAKRVILASSNNHLVMNRERRLYYTVEPRETSYRPSVDVFFNSVAAHWNGPVTAILLTGMGRDGAQGLLELRRTGAYTIAQDESTAAVYGMPKVALEMGAAVEVLPIQTISTVLRQSAREIARRWNQRNSRGAVSVQS